MKLELDLPEGLVGRLVQKSEAHSITPDEYAAEMLYQAIAWSEIDAEGEPENRPEWHEAIAEARADIAARRTVPHEEVVRWHESQLASNGPEEP